MQEAFSIQLREDQKTEIIPLQTLAYAINTEAAEVNRRAANIGAYLIQAKQQLPSEGSFMEWVAANCPFSHSTALGLMNYTKGIQETPCLIGKPKSIVLEVMKLPSSEREEFMETNGDKSVRQIRKLIEERDAAKAEAARRAEERDRFASGIEKANEALFSLKEQNDKLSNRLQSLIEAGPETVKVEVAPPDYEAIKAEAETKRAKIEALQRRAEEAEQYAEEQEALRKQAQSELRRIKDGSEYEAQPGTPYSAAALSDTVREFMGRVGPMPHMTTFFRSMPNDELHTIEQWLDVISEWMGGTRKAIDEGLQCIDVDGVEVR